MGKLVVGGIVVAVVGAGALLIGRAGARSPEERRPETVRAVRRDIGEVVKATGVIQPRIGAEVRVGSRVSGVVRRLFVRVGDQVERGQALAELDDRELRSRRDEAAAALALAEANLSYARSDLQRRRGLFEQQLLSPSDLETAERADAVAVQEAARARATLASAETQQGYARIEAPISGVVASVSTQEGETVAASFASPTFVTLVDLARLEVWAYVDETDIGRIRTGQTALFTVDTYAGEEFEGEVTAIQPQAEIRDNVVNYVAVVRFEPPSGRTLRPEMTAMVRIALDARRGVIAVPLGALRRREGRTHVLVRMVDGRVEERPVVTGRRDTMHIEIVNGVAEGDEVVVGEKKEPS